MQNSHLSLYKHVNRGQSCCITHHSLFLLHYRCSMKQQHRWKMLSKAIIVKATCLLKLVQNPVPYEAAFCKMTSASKCILLISTVLVTRLPLCYKEVRWLKKGKPKFQKVLGSNCAANNQKGSMFTFLDPHSPPRTARCLLVRCVVLAWASKRGGTSKYCLRARELLQTPYTLLACALPYSDQY